MIMSTRAWLDLVVQRTLRSDCAIESVAFDKDGFGCALAVGLENVDRFDRILDVTTRIDGPHGEHSVDGHVGEEVVIAVEGDESQLPGSAFTPEPRLTLQ